MLKMLPNKSHQDTPENRAISFCTRFIEKFFLLLNEKVKNASDRKTVKPSGTFSKAGKYVGGGVGGVVALILGAPGAGAKIGSRLAGAGGAAIDKARGKNSREG